MHLTRVVTLALHTRKAPSGAFRIFQSFPVVLLLMVAVTRAGAVETGSVCTPAQNALIPLLASLPAQSWWLASRNAFHEVWPAPALRPLNAGRAAQPSRLITAWGGFAWDHSRSALWLFGGGHGDYSGNEVYVWRGHDQRWQRASLPSEIQRDGNGIDMAIDGVFQAPAASHSYDNNVYLPLLDRLLSFGGAAYNNGGAWRRSDDDGTIRRTGPYLFDVSRADGDKVGGSSGSHVQREPNLSVPAGGQFWQNRDSYETPASGAVTPDNHVNGCTAYAEENGQDVVYVAARTGQGTALELFRYRILDVASRAADSWQLVGGYWQGPSEQTACAYDSRRHEFIRNGTASSPFLHWSLVSPGPENWQQRLSFSDPVGAFTAALADKTLRPHECGLDYDSHRDRMLLWCGGQNVWALTGPEMDRRPTDELGDTTRAESSNAAIDVTTPAKNANQWKIGLLPDASHQSPAAQVGHGVLGKWSYAPDLDVYVALQNGREGYVWFYKQEDWQAPCEPH